MARKAVIILIFFMFFASSAYAASEGVDLVIVVDQSKSIKKNLPVIKDFIAKRIFDQIAQPQDTVYLLSFDGQFYFKRKLSGSSNIFDIGYALDSVQAVGGYTDITNAVIEMSSFIDKQTDPKRKKIVFFLTDGLNEPPSYSKYPSKLDPALFAETLHLKKDGGWSVFITGIGAKTSAPDLAQILEGKYAQISSAPTLEEFDTNITQQLKIVRKRTGNPFSATVVATVAIAIAAASVGGVALFRKYKV
ncbi:MAG TPA: vWA domain-containing protein [Spirochaetota bacterium]|nr:vWA domain-containing protein [Spirochaetota bacterium]